MDRHESDWRSVLLAVGACAGALLAFSVAVMVVGLTMVGTFRPELASPKKSVLDAVVTASALAVIGAAFLPAAYYSIQHLRGSSTAVVRPRLLQVWQGILLVLLWLGAALGAQYLLSNTLAQWLTPALYVIAIGVPVFFFVRLAMGGISSGSRERLWGALATGIGLGTTSAMLAEILLAVVVLIGVGVFMGLHPEQLSALRQLQSQLQTANGIEQVLNIIGPSLTNPLIIGLALLFFSVLSPLIEETAKSLAVWAVFDRLHSPAQGFVIGAVSGAAFGLVESLLITANPDSSWTTTLLVRGGSTMMHIMAASLTGWGIGSLRVKGSLGKLIARYLLAMGLHGTWNASVVAITLGSVRSELAGGTLDLASTVLIYAGGAVLLLLVLAIPLALAGINWRLRSREARDIASVTAQAAPPEMWESLPRDKDGQTPAGPLP